MMSRTRRGRRFFRNWATFLKDHQHGRIGVVGIGNYLNSTENTLKQVEFARAPSPAGNRAYGVNFFSYAATTGVGTEEGSRRYDEAFYRALGRLFRRVGADATDGVETRADGGASDGHVAGRRTLTPVDGATVEVYREGSLVRTLTADGNGFFAAVHLPAGVYTLVVRAEGLPARSLGTVWVTAGMGVNLPVLLGEAEALTVRRIESLAALPDGTPVLLPSMVVAANWLQADAPLLGARRARRGEHPVRVDAPALPLLQGDRVAVLGTLRKHSDGAVAIDARGFTGWRVL
jgi:hypothetical protein